MKIRFIAQTMALTLALCLLPNCTNNTPPSDNSTKLNIMGQLGASYTAVPKSRGTLEVNQICVIPSGTKRGSWVGSLIKETKFFNIDNDSNFNIELSSQNYNWRDINWIGLLINSSAAKKDQIVGYIALPDSTSDASSDALITIQPSILKNDIDLGKLNQSVDESRSEKTIDQLASSFDLSTAVLKNIAKYNNILKCVKNNYINYNTSTGIYFTMVPRFMWKGNIASSIGIYTDQSAFTLTGYYPQFSFNDNSMSYSSIYSGGTVITITPPSTIHISLDNTYDADNPITSTGCAYLTGYGPSDHTDLIKMGNMAFACFANKSEGHINSLQTGYIDRKVSGYWTIKKDGTEIATFDLGLSSPMTNTNICTLFIPVINITKDGSNNMTEFNIKWYTYDEGTSGYTELTGTELNALANLIGSLTLEISNGVTPDYTEFFWSTPGDIEGLTSYTAFTKTHSITDLKILMSYGVGGMSLNFAFN